MRKDQATLLSVCTFLSVLLLFLVGCTVPKGATTTQSDGGSNQAGATGVLNYQIMTGTMDIPLYPGSELTWSDPGKDNSGLGGFNLKTKAQVAEVRAFYVQTLSASGWELVFEKGDEYEKNLNFVWINSASGPPTRRVLSLGIDNVTKQGAAIYANFGPWPDTNNVPLMPDAKQVENLWDRGLSRGFQDDRTVKVTTFVTASTPSEVEAFYKRTMPEYGWGLAAYVPRPGIAFNYSQLDPYGNGEAQGYEVWSYIVIGSERTAGGTTKVTIEASGTDLKQK